MDCQPRGEVFLPAVSPGRRTGTAPRVALSGRVAQPQVGCVFASRQPNPPQRGVRARLATTCHRATVARTPPCSAHSANARRRASG